MAAGEGRTGGRGLDDGLKDCGGDVLRRSGQGRRTQPRRGRHCDKSAVSRIVPLVWELLELVKYPVLSEL